MISREKASLDNLACDQKVAYILDTADALSWLGGEKQFGGYFFLDVG